MRSGLWRSVSSTRGLDIAREEAASRYQEQILTARRGRAENVERLLKSIRLTPSERGGAHKGACSLADTADEAAILAPSAASWPLNCLDPSIVRGEPKRVLMKRGDLEEGRDG